MKLTYNGIEFKILKTNVVRRDQVMSDDGLTYLYTRWFIDVYAVINRKAMSSPADSDPVTTDTDIRDKLRTPRRDLLLIQESGDSRQAGADTGTLINFKSGAQTCDVKGGPFPKLFNIDRVNGVSTFIVRWGCEYFSTQCDKPQVMLSHRWKAFDNVDENHFPTRTIQGQAVFNLQKLFGALDAQGGSEPLFADQFRRQLFHPVPAGYARTKISVTPGSDNATLNYTTVDTYQPIRWPKLAYTKVHAQHTSNCYQVSRGEEKFSFAFGEIVPAVLTGGTLSILKTLFVGGAKLTGRLLPQLTETVNVEVWGDARTSRRALLAMAFGIALGQLNFYLSRLPMTPSFAHDVTRSLTGKYVKVRTTIRIGPWNQLLSGTTASGKVFGTPWVPSDVDLTEEVKNRAGTQILLTPNSFNLPIYPPQAMGTRGAAGSQGQTSEMISLVTQALENPCSVSDVPDNQYVSQHPDKTLKAT